VRHQGSDAARPTLLILDLDETLIHADVEPLERPCDFNTAHYFVYIRPHLEQFLLTCARHFELAVWTSSTDAYAQIVVSHLLPAEIELTFLWARERCTLHVDPHTGELGWLKDLKKIKRRGYSLERVLVVDDSPEKLARTRGNLIRVRPFLGDPDDDELSKLARYLPTLADAENVRKVDKRDWRHHPICLG